MFITCSNKSESMLEFLDQDQRFNGILDVHQNTLESLCTHLTYICVKFSMSEHVFEIKIEINKTQTKSKHQTRND